jgi:hypothetical protein
MKLNEGYTEIDELEKLTTEIILYFSNKNYMIVNRIYKRKNNNYNFNIDGEYLSNIIHNKNEYNLVNNIIENDLYVTWNENTKYSHFTNKPFLIKLKYPNKDFIENLNYNITTVNKNQDDNSINTEDAIRILKTSLGVAYRSTIIHELKHAYDYLISKGNFNKSKKSRIYHKTYKSNLNSDMDFKQYEDYLNLPHEYQARFSQYISSISTFIKSRIVKNNFMVLFKEFKNSDIIKFNYIKDPKDKKKLIKSLYKYWYLKNKE